MSGPNTPTPQFRYVLQFLYKDISLPDARLDRAIASLTTEYDHRHAMYVIPNDNWMTVTPNSELKYIAMLCLKRK